MNRIDSLDWQRGLLALAIMAYHLTGWELHELDSSSLLGRLGIYGVSMFFVLSGLSMAVAYSTYIQGFESSLKFFVRRVFRIWPLLWLSVACATGAAMAAGHAPSWRVILLNLTTAFGFVEPSAYINIGAWSIGSEMVYYALTPLIIVAFNRSVAVGNLVTAGAAAVGAWFSFSILTPAHSLADQWAAYINPLNNLFLYCAGIGLYYNFHKVTLGARALAGVSVVAVGIFLLHPVSGDQINVVTGAGRVAFSLASILLVLAFYKNRIPVSQVLAVPLAQLGAVTYGVYLLHPIAYRVIVHSLGNLHMQLPAPATIAATFMAAIIMALVSFRVLEEPFAQLGRRLTAKALVEAGLRRPVGTPQASAAPGQLAPPQSA